MFHDFSQKKVSMVVFIAFFLSGSVFLTTFVTNKLGDDFFHDNLVEAKMAINAFEYKVSFAQANDKNLTASVISIFNDTDSIIKNNNDNAKSIPVLLYHGIVEKKDGANILLEDFKDQMFALKKAGWQTVSIDDFYKFMKGEINLPDKSFLLTFDDGRKDSYYPVDPILKALNYNAVIFVISKYSLENKSSNYYLSKNELKRMSESNRWEIEAHTREGHNIYKIAQDGKQGHYYSNKLWLDNENRLETEEEFTNRIKSDFAIAKNDIEQGLGTEVISFAFPFGDFGQDSVNFPEAEAIISDLAKSVYSIAFYQVWSGKGYSFNYPAKDSFLIKRIEVKLDWSTESLMTLLDVGKEKSFPYFDNFEEYRGWTKTWGRLTLGNNSIILDSNASTTGSSAFLDGTYLWQNYIFQADVNLMKGQVFSLTARYKDDKNYTACSFSDKVIKVEQVLNGEKTTLSELKGDFVFIGKNRKVGIGVYDNVINCYLDDKITMKGYNLDKGLDHGGIGFKTWDSQVNNSELIVKEVSVEEIK